MSVLIEQLQYAKDAVLWLIEHDGNVDFHGLSYWAQRFEQLREEIKKLL